MLCTESGAQDDWNVMSCISADKKHGGEQLLLKYESTGLNCCHMRIMI